MRIVIITSSSNDYLSRFNILKESVNKNCPNLDLLHYDDNQWPRLFPKDWEHHCSIRAKMCLDAFSKGYDKVLLVGSDTEFFDYPKEMLDLLETNNIVFTPYTREPVGVDDLYPNDFQLLQGGQANADMIGLRNTPATIKFLQWLDSVLEKHMFHKGQHLLDQYWWNYAFSLLDNVVMLRHSGYNVQYCAVDGMHQVDGKWFMKDNTPLVLFHYAGYNGDSKKMSRHQNRYKASVSIEEFYDNYKKRL